MLAVALAISACTAMSAHPQSRNGAQKIAPPIAEAVTAVTARSGATPSDLRALSTDFVRVNDAGEVQVYVVLTEFRPRYVADLEAAGMRVELTLPDSRLVQGWVPANRVAVVAGLDFVAEITPPGYPVRPRG